MSRTKKCFTNWPLRGLLGLSVLGAFTGLPAIAAGILAPNTIAEADSLTVDAPVVPTPSAVPSPIEAPSAAPTAPVGGAEAPDPSAADLSTDDASAADLTVESDEDAADQTVADETAAPEAAEPDALEGDGSDMADPAAPETDAAETPSDPAAPISPPAATTPVTPVEGGGELNTMPVTPATADPLVPAPDAVEGTTEPPAAAPPAEMTPETEAAPEAETDAVPDAEAAPDAEPSSAAPTEAIPVSQTELEQFAKSVPQLIEIQQTTDQAIASAIEESGLSQDRFREIVRSQPSPDASPAVELSASEQKAFKQAMASISTIEQGSLADQEDVIQANGLEPQRFSQILASIRQDPDLQSKVQEMIQP